MKKIVCIGEILIDFFTQQTDVNLVTAETFVKRAGGAPANVSVAVAKLGGDVRFCGKVGTDTFGQFLLNTLQQYKIDTRYLMQSTYPTTLAFVTRNQNGERDFEFIRGADGDMTLEDLAQWSFQEEIMHFGSATALLDEPFASSYINTMERMRQRGAFISFDPNFRADLWGNNVDDYFKKVRRCVELADFVKMSEEEYDAFQNYLTQNGDSISDVLKSIVAITLGEKGTKLYVGEYVEVIPSITIKVEDTTGAGDAFVGAMLYQIGQPQNDFIMEEIIAVRNDKEVVVSQKLWEQLLEMVAYSNKIGAFTCTKVGAMDAIPTKNNFD